MGLASSDTLGIRTGTAVRQKREQGVVLSVSEETTMITYVVAQE